MANDRETWLQHCKDKALSKDTALEAWAIFDHEMQKHGELKDHPALMLGALTLSRHIYPITEEGLVETRKFIGGFE